MAKKRKKKTLGKDYDVGYKRPPKQSQFQKGQSGNPSGRPKGPTTFLACFNKQLSNDVKIFKDGKEYRITGLSAVSQKFLSSILSGDYKFMKLFVDKFAQDINIEPYLYPEPAIYEEVADYRSPAYREALSKIRAELHKAMRQKLAEQDTLNQNTPPAED